MNLPDNEVLYTSSKISLGSVEWLWHSSYWDSPLSGMIKIQNDKYWVECFDELNSHVVDPIRRYAVFKLTPEQQESEEFWHELFKVCIGYHCDYDDKGVILRRGSYFTDLSVKFFYGRHKKDKKELDFSKAELVGWFER